MASFNERPQDAADFGLSANGQRLNDRNYNSSSGPESHHNNSQALNTGYDFDSNLTMPMQHTSNDASQMLDAQAIMVASSSAPYLDPSFHTNYDASGLQSTDYLQQGLDPSSTAATIAGGSLSPSTAQDQFSPYQINASPVLGHQMTSNMNGTSSATQLDTYYLNGVAPADMGTNMAFSNDQFHSVSTTGSPMVQPTPPTDASMYSPSGMSSPMMRQHSGTMNHSSPFETLNLQVPPFTGPTHNISTEPFVPTPTNGSSTDVSSLHPTHLRSPIVRVETYDEDQPQTTDGTGFFQKKRSKRFLTPHPDSEGSDDDDDGQGSSLYESPNQSQLAPNIERGEDGTWTNRAGLNPDERATMEGMNHLTIDELKQRRDLQESKQHVEVWLCNSDVGSESGEGDEPWKPKIRRQRAKSTNDVRHGQFNHGGSIATQAGYLSHPGPGLYINVPSEASDYSDGDTISRADSPPADITRDTEVRKDASLPPTANAAISAYKERTKETDTASLAATLGSRRHSESDFGSLMNAAGIARDVVGVPTPRRPSKGLPGKLFGNMFVNRANSKKRKEQETAQTQPQAQKQDPPQDVPTPVKRIGSFGRPKTPRIDTNVSMGSDVRSPGGGAGVIDRARSILRSRSKSDLSRSPKVGGLADLWHQQGGPPMPTLASPSAHLLPLQPTNDGDDDSGDDDEVLSHSVITMDLSVKPDMVIVPNSEGFKHQIRQLNPNAKDYLVKRLTEEQVKRYSRLLDFKNKHHSAVVSRQCASKKFCFMLGGEAESLPPRQNSKNSDAAPVIFQIIAPGTASKESEAANDGQTQTAQFPNGVPNPPVKFLPAKFECPFCFKVKEFKKPSDWTKHVHEDIQPFTCTFPNCNEPKSFKRKADWVRHENERHRQLESWTCNFSDCSHTCFRRDNFVQHLVREHKVPEPKIRTGRAAGSRSPITPNDQYGAQGTAGRPSSNGDESVEDYVGRLVDKCRQDSTKLAKDEPCRFCGNKCANWKKLTVHLAKHMEQICMPIINLVEQNQMAAKQQHLSVQQQHGLTVPALGANFMFDEPLDMDMSNSMGDGSVASNFMHSYPPPNMGAQFQAAGLSAPQSALDPNAFPVYVGQSYPPLLHPASRPRAASFNDVQNLAVPRPGSNGGFGGRPDLVGAASQRSQAASPVFGQEQLFGGAGGFHGNSNAPMRMNVQ